MPEEWINRGPTEKPFPFETLKHWYVTPYGGSSKDLEYHQVGIDRQALEKNTELVPFEDKVIISVLGKRRIRPLFTQRWFEVVPLDNELPDALSKSPHGEAVLPAEEWEIIRRPFLQPRHGEPLLLNSVASKLLGPEPEKWLVDIVAKEMKRRGFGS